MKVIFNEIMNKTIIPFFKSNGFEQKDINSDTNKTLGIESFYFYKIEGDLNRNFYFESNSDNSEVKYEFKMDFGMYPYSVYKTLGFPENDAPNGLGNLFYLSSEDIFNNKSYWQSLSKGTDIQIFEKDLLTNLQALIQKFESIDSVDSLLPFCINQKSNAYNYNYLIRYLKITDKKDFLEKYVSELRTADGSPLPDWMMKDVKALLDTTILKQKVINNFTEGMKVPKSWEKVLDWSEKNIGKILSGHFEIIDNSNNILQHLVDVNGKAAKSLAVLGDNGADSVFCIWQKDKKNAPVVTIGEAGAARVLAENMDDFIQLLAVGYYDVEVGEYDKEPTFYDNSGRWTNPEFQAFYKKTFKKEIPKTGAEIVARITAKEDDFFNWLCDNDALWKEWKN